MTTHRLSCECGRLTGDVDASAAVNRCTCYCKDCRVIAAFARHGTSSAPQ